MTTRMTLRDLIARFQTEEDCKAFLVERRWPEGVHCPRCGNVKVWAVKSRPFHWLCKGCNKNGYRFSVITKTIFENTKYPLTEWFKVAFLMYHSKKGMSALQIHRMIGTGSYETAWYMCHRLRVAMKNSAKGQLFGEVEVDETFVGGLAKNRHVGKRGQGAAALAASALARSPSSAQSVVRARLRPASLKVSMAQRSKRLCVRPYPRRSVCSSPTNG
jgi:transposase-like protein